VQIEQSLAECGGTSLQREPPDEEFQDGIHFRLPFVYLAGREVPGDLFGLIS